MLQVSEKHKKCVTCISAIVLSQTDALFASSSSDGVVSIWEIIFPSSAGGELLGLEQSYTIKSAFALHWYYIQFQCLYLSFYRGTFVIVKYQLMWIVVEVSMLQLIICSSLLFDFSYLFIWISQVNASCLACILLLLVENLWLLFHLWSCLETVGT